MIRRVLCLTAALAVCSSTFAAPPRTPGDGTLRLYYADVGQGDAAVIVTPNGTVVGIDARPSSGCDELLWRSSSPVTARLST